MTQHIINRNDKRPLFKQIAENFILDIEKEVLKKDTPLPSINDYHFQYSVGRDTIEKSYKELKKQGYVISVPSKGYYVNGKQREGNYKSEFHHVQQDIYKALCTVNKKLNKYDKLAIVFPIPCDYPIEIIKGVRQYCNASKKAFTILENTNDELSAGTVYLLPDEKDLVKLLKKINASSYTTGKEIGIISFNETALKEFLDITVFTNDFINNKQMKAALTSDKTPSKVSSPFHLVQRGSI
jgi:DNA-binding transcriptional regulator YhcF (GntR family)